MSLSWRVYEKADICGGIINPEVFVGGDREGVGLFRRRFALRHNDRPCRKTRHRPMSRTTGRSCNCIATSPTAKLQMETARHTDSRPLARARRAVAPFNPGRVYTSRDRTAKERAQLCGQTTARGRQGSGNDWNFRGFPGASKTRRGRRIPKIPNKASIGGRRCLWSAISRTAILWRAMLESPEAVEDNARLTSRLAKLIQALANENARDRDRQYLLRQFNIFDKSLSRSVTFRT